VLTFVTIFHLLVCVLLTIVILMQASKGGGLSGAFGGQGSMGAVFGGRGAGNFLSKTTIILATIFMLGSVAQGLIKRSSGDRRSLIQEEVQNSGTNSPAELLPAIPGEPGISPVNQGTQPTSVPVDTSKD
jgi:preprotein translocase subunit SecG